MLFLADMGVGAKVVNWLRDQGHNATHLSDESLQRMPNGEIFSKAISEKRVILTFDLDFGEIAALSKGEEASVIVFRLHNTRVDNVIKRLSHVLPPVTVALEKGAVVIVEDSRYRIRSFPIGG